MKNLIALGLLISAILFSGCLSSSKPYRIVNLKNDAGYNVYLIQQKSPHHQDRKKSWEFVDDHAYQNLDTAMARLNKIKKEEIRTVYIR